MLGEQIGSKLRLKLLVKIKDSSLAESAEARTLTSFSYRQEELMNP
jgi:hypothetical protein